MPAYNVTNTAGATIATIGVATTTGLAFPIELIGQGISLYGPIIASTQYRLMENFAFDTPPPNPVQGMIWYAPTGDVVSYYDGTQWVPLSSGSNNSGVMFEMLPAATNIDLTVAGITPIFTDPNNGKTFHPTALLLKVNGVPGATSPAFANLMISSSEDVLENVSIHLPDNSRHGYYIIQGTTHVATGGATLSLEVTSPASGGALNVDAYVFGFTTV